MPYSRAMGITAQKAKLNGLRGELSNGDPLFRLRLMATAVEQRQDRTIGDFTESTFTGYESVQYQFADWSDADLEGELTRVVMTKLATFLNSGSTTTVYGYYVTTDAFGGDSYLWGETFATPYVLESGQSMSIRPILYDVTIPG